ncbi:tetratricopeptide repeat protein [Legionella brunensis]|uniref:Tetratricopeptide repeat protein n=1 Tax=Legionella brunensis TaxID=29422 RepID=A0A0W0SUT6_9GAMM|nr:hypothetical protein [Legionella brunensis]KTC87028.1 Tetratricopeptide repeat protein [Legionella brunensis]
MKLSKIIVTFISCFVLMNTAFSQDKIIETKNISGSSNYQLENILNDFSLLSWDAREKELQNVIDKIERLATTSDKNLFLARAYTIFPGKKYVNLNKASNLIENYLKHNPESYEGYLVRAKFIIEKNDLDFFRYMVKPSKEKIKEHNEAHDQALGEIEKSLKIKDSAEGYQLKARLSEGEEKIKLLEKSISINHNYNEAWRELVSELRYKHRYDEAFSKLGEWIKNTQNPNLTIEILRELASVLRDQREPQNSVQVLNTALAIRNKTGSDGLDTIYSALDDIYLDLARSYKDAKDTKHAEEYYKKYLILNPKSWYTRFELAYLYDSSGQVNKAITQYEQVLAYNKNSSSSIYNLGLLYEKIDEEKSKELFIKYIKLNIDKEDEHSIKWIENAKSQLRSMGVFDYPQSKKELENLKPKSSSLSKWLLLLFLLPFSWKYKKATRFIIISSMTAAVVFISIIEADSSDPSLVKAFLYFIPVVCTGTFLLYVFRKQQ